VAPGLTAAEQPRQLAGLTRVKPMTKIGHQTCVTLKLYHGMPTRLIRHPKGHQTEEVFNLYVGVAEIRLLEEYLRKGARRRAA
jgi:hypothetical protein